MGLIRSILIVFSCILLFIGVFSVGVFFVSSNSLIYENIYSSISPIVSSNLNEELSQNPSLINLTKIKKTCSNYSEYSFLISNSVINLPCSYSNSSSEEIFSFILDKEIENFYYKDYSCNSFKCILDPTNFGYILSNNNRLFLERYLRYSLLFCLICLGLILFFIHKKSNLLFLFSIISIISVIFFRFIFIFLIGFLESKIANILDLAFKFPSSSLIYINQYFIYVLVLGLISLGLFFLWKLFLVGFKIERFIDSFRKEPSTVKKISSNKNV